MRLATWESKHVQSRRLQLTRARTMVTSTHARTYPGITPLSISPTYAVRYMGVTSAARPWPPASRAPPRTPPRSALHPRCRPLAASWMPRPPQPPRPASSWTCRPLPPLPPPPPPYLASSEANKSSERCCDLPRIAATSAPPPPPPPCPPRPPESSSTGVGASGSMLGSGLASVALAHLRKRG